MKNLYLIVFEAQDFEVEWFHKVIDTNYLSTDDERKAVKEYLKENHETDIADLEYLEIWGNKIDTQDGYAIKLEKVEANAKA